MDTDPVVVADLSTLRALTRAALDATGLAEPAADAATDVLLRTSARGVASHGLHGLPQYVRQLREGGAVVHATPRTVVDRGPVAMVDAEGGLGPAMAAMVTADAIRRAKEHGSATVTVRNANHFGAAGHYALMCAEAGCIGLVASNTPPIMAATGSAVRSIGNSPLGFGAPRSAEDPFVLDIAMSIVAGGKVRLALARGDSVPEGWILDPEGRPTTDPADFLERRGALLPLADHKGYGLALMIEALAGALSGSAVLGDVGNWLYAPDTPSDTGHFLFVLDVGPAAAFAAFADRFAELAGRLTAAPRAPGVDRILVPGQIEAEAERRAAREGIAFDRIAWLPLQRLADEVGFPLAPELRLT